MSLVFFYVVFPCLWWYELASVELNQVADGGEAPKDASLILKLAVGVVVTTCETWTEKQKTWRTCTHK